MATLRVLGIDPGFDRVGLGVVDVEGSRLIHVAHDCIQTSSKDELATRLQVIRDGLTQAIRTHKPKAVVIEQLFFQKNVSTAIHVGMARGVILLAAADAGLVAVELNPKQVKQGITGYGAADKKQVQDMVKRLLNLKIIPKPDDAADALALAIVGSGLVRLKS